VVTATCKTVGLLQDFALHNGTWSVIKAGLIHDICNWVTNPERCKFTP